MHNGHVTACMHHACNDRCRLRLETQVPLPIFCSSKACWSHSTRQDCAALTYNCTQQLRSGPHRLHQTTTVPLTVCQCCSFACQQSNDQTTRSTPSDRCLITAATCTQKKPAQPTHALTT